MTAFGAGEARARLVRAGGMPLATATLVIVTAIVDTGLRLRFAVQALQAYEPACIAILTLLDRPDRRIADIPLEHVGFTVGGLPVRRLRTGPRALVDVAA